MKFLEENFLLQNDVAKELFHHYAKEQPIIDYHCHLDPKEMVENSHFKNLTEAWLGGDHYKWRLMRACGVDESLITGDADDYEKFLAWCKTVPRIIGNPLYTWTHLELKRFFGIDLMVNEENAPEIWRRANEKLQEDDFKKRNIIANSHVAVVCTTDDPTDNLEYHQQLSQVEHRFKVLPTFRPDKALNIQKPTFLPFVAALSTVTNKELTTYAAFIEALYERIDFFHQLGGRLSDHALDVLVYNEATDEELEHIYKKALAGDTLTQSEIHAYRSETLYRLLRKYHEKNWTAQLHIHAYRDCNRRMFEKLGPDTGYDGINDRSLTEHLQLLLDRAEYHDELPKTILYSLNDNDFITLAVLMGSYQKEYRNKLQLGSGWWYIDTRDGMRKQLATYANTSVLHNFVGMLTDSRSFLSYTRHEYFRRVLCEFLSEISERGEAPDDIQLLGQMVSDICYNNAKEYFKF